MAELDAHGAATGTGDRSRPRAVLPALCATQITSWGIVYYAFPVLLPRITAGTGWSPGTATAAFSLALLVSAAVGIPVGRVIDRRGPHAVMTAGSVLAALALLAIAAAPNPAVFTIAWAAAGAAMAATFYHPAFAAVTRWWGPDRVRALTIVTLAGGLASTVFAPLTATLAEHLSWRATYAVLAAILAAVTIPAHALALRAPWPPPPAPAPSPQVPPPGPQVPSPGAQVPSPGPQAPSPGPKLPTSGPPTLSPNPQVPKPGPQAPTPGAKLPGPGPQAPTPGAKLPAPGPQAPTPGPQLPRAQRPTARTRPFLLLSAAFALSGFAMYAVVIGLVPLLLERGASPTAAAWALGLGGVGQTLGRTLYAALARRTTATARTAALIAAGGATTLALALVPGPIALLTALAVVAGMVRGNLTLLQATAVADRWGTGAYGRLSGLLAAPVTVAAAIAPWASTTLAHGLGSHPGMFGVLAVTSLLAAALALGTRPRSGAPHS